MENMIDMLMEEMNIDRNHAETLAKSFFILLKDEFNLLTVAYSVFLIMGNVYEMLDSQDPGSAAMFKQMMCDLSKEMGKH